MFLEALIKRDREGAAEKTKHINVRVLDAFGDFKNTLTTDTSNLTDDATDTTTDTTTDTHWWWSRRN